MILWCKLIFMKTASLILYGKFLSQWSVKTLGIQGLVVGNNTLCQVFTKHIDISITVWEVLKSEWQGDPYASVNQFTIGSDNGLSIIQRHVFIQPVLNQSHFVPQE